MKSELLDIVKNKEEVLEPNTIRQLEPDLPETDVQKILAMSVLYKTRHFWENMYSFEDIVLGLNGIEPNFELLQGTTPDLIWYALDIAQKLFPENEFSLEVQEYCRFMFNGEGIFIYHPYLQLPNPYYDAAIKLAENGPFPLGESLEEIQAAKYLEIKEYIKNATS